MLNSSQFSVTLVLPIFITTILSAQTVITVPTFHNIGIEVNYTTSAPIEIEYRKAGTSTFIGGHPLSRTSEGNRGSIVQLQDGTIYEIKLKSNIFEGDETVVVCTTRFNTFPQAIGNELHVGSGQTYSTISEAVKAAQPGDKVLIHAGTYYEGDSALVSKKSGTATAPIVIRNYPGDKVIISGEDPNFSPIWSQYSGGIYRTSYSSTGIAAAYYKGEHMYPYETTDELQSNKYNMKMAFCFSDNYLYVRIPGRGQPAVNTVKVPNLVQAFILNKSYIHIIGLEICFFGKSTSSTGIMFGQGGSNCLVDSCNIHHCISGITFDGQCEFNTIQNCTFNESPEGDWDWCSFKRGAGTLAISREKGVLFIPSNSFVTKGNVFRYNTGESFVDAAHIAPEGGSGITTHFDFYGNTLINFSDDLEFDGRISNVRFYNNYLNDFVSGVSIAPAYVGPIYIFRNTITNWHSNSCHTSWGGMPFKNSSGGSEWQYLYHNTCYSSVPGQVAFHFHSDAGMSNNHTYKNNIFRALSAVLSQEGSPPKPLVMDYNSWTGNNYNNLDNLQSLINGGRHDIRSAPRFVNTSEGDYRLQKDAPQIDKGVIIPGFNNYMIKGSAPDMGAFEYGYVGSVIPKMNLISFPNLINGMTLKLKIYDITGKLVDKIDPISENGTNNKYIWDSGSLNSGIYIYRLDIDRKTYIKKLISIR